jgi:carboxypeptidase PM20D1
MRSEMCAMVGVHEKGRLILKCTAENESSHLTLTAFKGNPVERMTGFVQELTTKNLFIRRLHPQTKAMFTALAPYCKLPIKLLLSNLWFFGGLMTKILPKISPLVGGMVGTTCHFIDIEGNVHKKVCTATVLLRNVNAEDLKADYAALKAVADRYGITLETTRDEDYAPADMDSAAYHYTMECIGKVFPRFPAVPYILAAATDAWRLSPVCSCVLRFAPTRMTRSQLASIHAADENLDISAVAEAAAFYKYFVENYR